MSAQQIFRSADNTDNIGIQFSHIFARDDVFGKFPSVFGDLSGTFRLSNKVDFEASLPFAIVQSNDVTFDRPPQTVSAQHAGNPWLGLAIDPKIPELGIAPNSTMPYSNGLDHFSDKDVNQVAFTVEGARGHFRPMLGVKTFLDNAIRSSGFRAVLTLGARITMH